MKKLDLLTRDCNACARAHCKGDVGRKCPGHQPVKSSWKLCELALSHPTSLNAALSALPFNTNLNFHLPKA